MKLLVISNYWVEPASTAAGARMMQLLLTFLEEDWQITYATTAPPSDYATNLGELGIVTQSIAMNDPAFNAFAVAQAPDIVLYDRFMAEEQFGWRIATYCPEALTLLDTEDLHCLRNARSIALRAARQYTAADLVSDIAKREIASIYRCDLTLMISEYEIEVLQREFNIPSALLLYIPFLLGTINDEFTGYDERSHFVFIGNYHHGPNRDATLVLKNHIWPLIKKKLPKAELHIYGAYLPAKIAQLHNAKTGFQVKGRAEHAQEVIAKSRVLLAPLRYGAGLKGKLIDAMCSGTPSVTTDIGAEGIAGKHSWPGEIVRFSGVEDSSFYSAFAKAAIQTYTSKENYGTAQSLGVDIINSRFQKNTHKSSLLDYIAHLKQDLKKHREANFIGQMLQFHTMRSTEFMSRWIEAKNKS